jgi:hypothetical protein
MGRKVGLNGLEERIFLTLPGLELRPLGRPARSQSLYRLRYPCSCQRISQTRNEHEAVSLFLRRHDPPKLLLYFIVQQGVLSWK